MNKHNRIFVSSLSNTELHTLLVSLDKKLLSVLEHNPTDYEEINFITSHRHTANKVLTSRGYSAHLEDNYELMNEMTESEIDFLTDEEQVRIVMETK